MAKKIKRVIENYLDAIPAGKALLATAWLVWVGVARAATYTQTELQTARDDSAEVIPLEATVTDSPPQISIKTYVPGLFEIYRKHHTNTVWGDVFATNIALAAGGVWIDTNVVAGMLYEYKWINSTGAPYYYNYNIKPTGYLLSGIKVDQTQPRGRLALVVTEDIPADLPGEYAQFKDDLRLDGWTVHEIPVPNGSYSGMANGTIQSVTVVSGGTNYISGDLVKLQNAAGTNAYATITVNANKAVTIGTIVHGGKGFAVGQNLSVQSKSAVGGGAQLISRLDTNNTALTGADASYGGSGYVSWQNVTLLGQSSGATVTGRINAVGGVLIRVFANDDVSGFIPGEHLTMTGHTAGAGATALIAQTGEIEPGVNVLYAGVLAAAGSGYTNEVVTLTGETSGKTAQADMTTTYDGIIDYLSIISSEFGFVPGEWLSLSGNTQGAGVGLIKSEVTAPLGSVGITSGGTNYVNGDEVTLNEYSGVDSGVATGVLYTAGGVITGVVVTARGIGFTDGHALYLEDLAEYSSGAVLRVSVLNNGDMGYGVAVSNGGGGYIDNDRVLITGQSSGAKAYGSLLAPSGSIMGVLTVLPIRFAAGETLALTPGTGMGSGALVTAGATNDQHLLIREAVRVVYATYPGELKTLSVVGNVSVTRSGINDNWGADGHGNQCAYGTDAYYADMDGNWTDTGDNMVTHNETTLNKVNLPGDGRFDQKTIFETGADGTGGAMELGLGRVDLTLGIYNAREAFRNYFNKLHRYKTASPDFKPGRRVGDRLLYQNVRETSIMAMPAVAGMSNIEVVAMAGLNVAPNDDPDQAYTALNGPYLFYFKGSSVPSFGDGGQAVFWTGMQSHFGYWYDGAGVSSGANAMQQRLSEDSFTLSFTWSIWGLRYFYHRMAMGFDAGDMMRVSLNNDGWKPAATYAYKFDNVNNGDYHGSLFMHHMGDPTLRLYMFEPPANVAVTNNAGHSAIVWESSPASGVIGYHVYRQSGGTGTPVRLTSVPVVGTSYDDVTVSSGRHSYMVRAVRLETTGAGTFYNPSLGVEVEINLDGSPSAMAVVTPDTVSEAAWNTGYEQVLGATGGVPWYVWTVSDGALPAGLVLTSRGAITGVTVQAGTYAFTVRATDRLGTTAEKAYTLDVGYNASNVLFPEATAFVWGGSSSKDTNYGLSEYSLVGWGQETYHRYNLAGVNLNHGFIRATLQLYVSLATGTGIYALVEANLVDDSKDGWVESERTHTFSAYTNNGAGLVRIISTNHSFITGSRVSISGFTPTTANGTWDITRVDGNRYDIPVSYTAGWAIASGKGYSGGLTYNNRPTTYNPRMPALAVSGYPEPYTLLEMDVTPFVRETLANDPEKLMSLQLFTKSYKTTYLGSRRSYGAARPRLIFETSDAPVITILSPSLSPACISPGTGLGIEATVTAIPARTGTVTLLWTKLSGPGTVVFTRDATASTEVTFSSPGDYVLRITAFDGALQSTRDLLVRVLPVAVNGPQQGVRLRLPLDEESGTVASDVSGLTPPNSGVLTNKSGGAIPGWSPAGGRVGGALVVDGSGQRIQIADSAANPLDGMQQFSVSLWLFANTLPGSRGILAKRKANLVSESFGLATTAANFLSAKIGPATALVGAITITSQKWHNVVMVFDGTQTNKNVKVYLNGCPDIYGLAATNGIPLTTVPRISNTWFCIGAMDTNSTSGWNGKIDEVRIYDRALTQEEVLDLYAAAPLNMGPKVSVEGPVSGYTGIPVDIRGSASDDGLPGPLVVNWSRVSGSGGATFGNASSTATTATVSTPGVTTLRLTAHDGLISTWADLLATITDPLRLGIPGGGFANGLFRMTYQKAEGSTDLYTVEVSTNLQTWYTQAVTQIELPVTNGLQAIEIQLPMTSDPLKFFRMRMDPQ